MSGYEPYEENDALRRSREERLRRMSERREELKRRRVTAEEGAAEDAGIGSRAEEAQKSRDQQQWDARVSAPSAPQARRGGWKKAVAGLLAVALVGTGTGYLGSYLERQSNGTNAAEHAVGQTASITLQPKEDEGVVAAVAKKALPSVVGITTKEQMRDIFGRSSEVEGVGSGVIIDAKGYILTNSHVVGDGGASSISVFLGEGKTVEAKLLWNDRAMDLAVIKIDAPGLVAAELGDSDKLEIGERAIAIGNPLGLAFNRSVTAGFISGINRTIETSEGNVVDNLIQTDAAINRGNSGGPLLNAKGQVIGINTIKIGGNSAESLGFAIPINTAKAIVKSVIDKGTDGQVMLGISMVDYRAFKSAMQIQDKYDYGAIIRAVEPGSNADRAGLKPGDVLLEFEGQKLTQPQSLRTKLLSHSRGDHVQLKILRNGQEETVDVELR